MRFPDKENKPFGDPCWKADDLRAYSGPVFHATVSWITDHGNREYSDVDAPSEDVLESQVRQILGSLHAKNKQGVSVVGRSPSSKDPALNALLKEQYKE